MIMDFTTTAMARPDIVDKTYTTFSKNLKGINLKECRLFINIDPLPKDIDRKKVTEVAQKHFKEVYSNYPDKPNYTAAYNWIWSSAESEFIFNLEDDWELLREISVPELLKYFKKYPYLMEVALRAYSYKYKACPTSPSIMHSRYYKAVAGKLNEKINPEIQLRGKNFGIEMPAPRFKISWKGKIIAYPEQNKEELIILKDLGREWLKKSEFKRPKGKKGFTTWEIKNK